MQKSTAVNRAVAQGGAEKRRDERVSYKCKQRIAFGTAPDAEFVEVEFRDLSTTGCSFWYKQLLPVEEIVVELGRPPHLIYLKARVVHVTPVLVGGLSSFVIGCEFTGRR
jgi:PilZ domain-containing protein